MPRVVVSRLLLVGGASIAAGGMLLVDYGRIAGEPPYPGASGNFRVVVHPYSGAGIAVLAVGLAITFFGTVGSVWPSRRR